MSTPRAALLVAVGLALAAAASAAERPRPPGPGLGRPTSAAEVAAADISVGPDGATLPPGSGDPVRGARVYGEQCEACHGPAGAGGPMDRLTGGLGSLTSARPIKTAASFWPYATTLFDYVRRAMPLQAPQSLTDEDVYSVVAYLLSIDGVVAKDAVLDARSLPQVRMPNRDGFIRKEP